MEFLTQFFDTYGLLLAQGTWDTIVMTGVSTLFAYIIGVPLGVALIVTAPNGLKPHRVLNAVLGWIVNIGRSIPFIILLVALIPFTRWIVGTSLGVPGAIVPLVVASAPFVACPSRSSRCSATRPWRARWARVAWATSPSVTATSATRTTS